jgi:hypothetical protein
MKETGRRLVAAFALALCIWTGAPFLLGSTDAAASTASATSPSILRPADVRALEAQSAVMHRTEEIGAEVARKLAVQSVLAEAAIALYGREDQFWAGVGQNHFVTFYVQVGYGWHHIEWWGGYSDGNQFCGSSSCYQQHYVNVGSGQYLDTVFLYGDSWGDIYGYGGY